MQYRGKLFISIAIVAVGSALLGLSIIFTKCELMTLETIQETTLSIAKTGAIAVDKKALEEAISGDTASDSQVRSLKRFLQEIRDTNRTTDFYILNAYLVVPSPENPREFIFITDAEEHPELSYKYGDKFPGYEDIAEGFKKAFVPDEVSSDRWGVWMTGYAPIYGAGNRYLGALGLDINAEAYHQQLHALLLSGSLGLGISFFVALFTAFFLSAFVSRSLKKIKEAVAKVEEGELVYDLELNTHDEFDDVSKAIKEMVDGLKERERIKMGFARYVSQYVLDQVIQMDTEKITSGERKKITILFADIRNFTTLAEKLSPENVVAILNEYFSQMIEVIFHFHGTLDKFIGDGMMVEFGAPLPDEQQEKHAVWAAIRMQQKLEESNKKWSSEGKPMLGIGIGIHSGQAIIGNIGSDKRMEFTAIGDTVNLASRLEQATKKYSKPIIVSKTVYENIKDEFNWESLGMIQVPGREEAIECFVPSPKPGSNSDQEHKK